MSIPPVTRRRFLRSSAGMAAAAFALSLSRVSRADDAMTLVAATRQIEVAGRAATAYGLTGTDGRAGLTIGPGRPFAVTLVNRLTEPTLVHWHGLTPPWKQDGVPDLSQPALAPGKSYTYDFPLTRGGTFWMHSHLGLQEQQLFAAPLIVYGAEAQSADEHEVVVLLHDFSFRPATEILASLRTSPAGMTGMNMSGMDMSGMAMGQMSGGQTGSGMSGMASDINDFDFDAYLANDRSLTDPEVFRVEPGGNVRLRIINGAAATGFWIDLGHLEGELTAVDGDPVMPVAGRLFPVSMGQRLDIRLRLPVGRESYPILAIREGDTARTGIVLATTGATIAKLSSKADARSDALNLSLESRLHALDSLPARDTDRQIEIDLVGNMQSYDWRMLQNGQPAAPAIKTGERVEILIRNQSMMAHPMHLHGHHFQVVAINGRRLSGAMRDTVLVGPMGSLAIAFDANNPGRWAFHCHHLYHMASGMMSTLQYDGVG